MSHYNVDLGVILPRLGNDALHATQCPTSILIRVLIVIHGELDKQHIQRTLAQHVSL